MAASNAVLATFSHTPHASDQGRPRTEVMKFPVPPPPSTAPDPTAVPSYLSRLVTALEKAHVDVNAFLTDEMAREARERTATGGQTVSPASTEDASQPAGEIDEEELYDVEEQGDDLE